MRHREPGSSDQTGGKPIQQELRICTDDSAVFFFGVLGVHRFYVGKVGTGILQLLTPGGLGIWALVDFIMIVVGSFTDKQGKFIKAGN